MGPVRTRLLVSVLSLGVLPATIGVVAVHASPACERYVHTYVTVPIRNRVSKATAAGWAKWRIGHPNWKPNPAVHRPQYVMTKQEAMHKVAFACDVPATPATPDIFLTGIDSSKPPIDVTPAFLDQTLDTTPVPPAPEFVAAGPVPDNPFFAAPGFLIPPLFAASPGGGGSPAAPGTPVTTPTTPGTPITPGIPTTPTTPVTPVTPGSPGTPGTPGTPITPVTPGTPVALTPEPPSIFLLALGMGSAWLLWKRSSSAAVRNELT